MAVATTLVPRRRARGKPKPNPDPDPNPNSNPNQVAPRLGLDLTNARDHSFSLALGLALVAQAFEPHAVGPLALTPALARALLLPTRPRHQTSRDLPCLAAQNNDNARLGTEGASLAAQ